MQTLGIDCSNYTTSTARYNGQQVWQQQTRLQVPQGALGLRQSEALFQHVQHLPQCLESLLSPPLEPLCAVGASQAPRNTQGSYMPCFLPGTLVARSIAAALQVPLFLYSHQQGHLAAALLSLGQAELCQQPFLALHLSGGTTDLLHSAPGLCISRWGGTADLNAGQLVDRVGNLLGLPFPAGPALDSLAWQAYASPNPSAHRLPKPAMQNMQCNLSGVQNQCETLHRKGAPPGEVALFCLSAIASACIALLQAALRRAPNLPILLCGGVSASQTLQALVHAQLPQAQVATPQLATDNAAGIAALAFWAHTGGTA